MEKAGSMPALELLLLARDPHTPPAGIYPCPPHLPHGLLALEGETLAQLARRALHLATGEGAAMAVVFYADEVMH